jgi:hypothetical protein
MGVVDIKTSARKANQSGQVLRTKNEGEGQGCACQQSRQSKTTLHDCPDFIAANPLA